MDGVTITPPLGVGVVSGIQQPRDQSVDGVTITPPLGAGVDALRYIPSDFAVVAAKGGCVVSLRFRQLESRGGHRDAASAWLRSQEHYGSWPRPDWNEAERRTKGWQFALNAARSIARNAGQVGAPPRRQAMSVTRERGRGPQSLPRPPADQPAVLRFARRSRNQGLASRACTHTAGIR